MPRTTSTSDTLERLGSEVVAAIQESARGGLRAWSDLEFRERSSALFAAQNGAVEPYAAWCRAMSARTLWHDDGTLNGACLLPVETFKHQRIAGHSPAQDARVWWSSATTSGTSSKHALPSLDCYDASLAAGARAALVPDGAALHCLQLVPSGVDAPHSSLAHMCDYVRLHLCASGTVFATTTDIDVEGIVSALHEAAQGDAPVLILATSFALVHLLDALDSTLHLPAGSRVMDTGGFKGRSREVTRGALLSAIAERLGIDPDWCENEYGMSELSSQAWLGTIARTVGHPLLPIRSDAHSAAVMPRWTPPWMRSYVLDPRTLTEVPDGALGLLAHIDLANTWSCAFVRTDDLARRVGHSFELLGRAPGAEMRGCSLTVEELLASEGSLAT